MQFPSTNAPIRPFTSVSIETVAYSMFPQIAFDLRTKTCSNSKCYSDLCASNRTRGAVG
ncbi:hypothetical protein GFB56_06980 [Ensifer sp. T173]|uniref:Uncharacterized protein n=1 Tax=Ensifer canadensis TaxID=555315 RepID=A0AAW4FEJ5_9HYPH|nr:hypothetical protein [Ensifer canadensis]